jgi:hypothetical protein
MEVSGQLHAPAALPPGKEPLVSIGQEAGWAPEPFWTPGIEPWNPDRQARSPAQYQLTYRGYSHYLDFFKRNTKINLLEMFEVCFLTSPTKA